MKYLPPSAIFRVRLFCSDDYCQGAKGSVLSIAELHAVENFAHCLNIMKDYEKIALYQLNIPHIRAIFRIFPLTEFAFRLIKPF